jgi:winged helix DNA-binding protein
VRLRLTREQILAFRRRAASLDERLPPGAGSLRRAAWAGLQDSMPRAALLSLHARVEGIGPTSWEDPSLVQVWGPRHHTYVVPRQDFALFSLARLPDDAKGRERAERMAALVHHQASGGPIADRRIEMPPGVHPNALKYGALTGTIAIRWDGARAPVVSVFDPGAIDPAEARRELARRHLRVFGPTTAAGFARWAGISQRAGTATYASLEPELLPVDSPLGDEWLLAADEPDVRAEPTPPAPARLLPSGDAYFLLDGAERDLLVPDPARRPLLWTPRVWPGALLVGGEVAGTWRRATHVVRIELWDRLSPAAREAVEAEARSLPLPGVDGGIDVVWGAM